MLTTTPPSPKRPQGISLLEMLVAIGVMSIVMVGAFSVMREGVSLVRTNQRAADAQISVLQALGHITNETVNAHKDLIEIYSAPPAGGGPGGSTLPGLVFASPLMDDGGVRTDPDSGEVYWQKWICFYYQPGDPGQGTYGKIHRCEEKIPPDNVLQGPGSKNIPGVVAAGLSSRTPNYFQANPQLPRKLMGSDISGFQIGEYGGDLDRSGSIEGTESASVFNKSYLVTVEAGDKDDQRSDGYYIEVSSQVTPRG